MPFKYVYSLLCFALALMFLQCQKDYGVDPHLINDLEIFIAYDKPWDEDFQDVPGTPGRGDQFSLGFTYSW